MSALDKVDLDALGTSMIDAAREAVSTRWPVLKSLAETELRGLAVSLVDVHRQVREGKITREAAQKIIHIQQMSVRGVLRTIEGIGILTAEQVTHAATKAAAGVLSQLIGIKLL